MSWACRGCGNENAYHVITRFDEKFGIEESCDRCGASAPEGMPDVYWPGHEYTSPHICDDAGVPIPLTSRKQKAQVMKELGLSEAGDRIHGSTDLPKKTWIEGTREARRKEWQNESRPKVREAYEAWRRKNS